MRALASVGIGLALLAVAATALGAELRPWAKSVPDAAKKAKSPLGAGPEVIAAGKEAFTNTCLPCHGAGAQGDGPAAAMIKPKPKPLVIDNKMSITNDGVIFWVITNGIDNTAMASLSDVLTETERWQVIAYLHTLATPPDSGATSAVTPGPTAAASPEAKDPPARADVTPKPGKQASNEATPTPTESPKPSVKKKAPRPPAVDPPEAAK